MLPEPPAIVCLVPPPPAAGASRDDVYARAVKERLAGDNARALSDLQDLLANQPEDVDARLQLGFALRAAGRPAEAEAAFREVLRRAPDYKDARVALAGLLWARGDVADAKATLGPEIMATPGDAETRALVEKLASPKPVPLWRVDETLLYSQLSRDLPDWWENDLSLSRKVDPQSAITATVQTLSRFDIAETYLEGAYDHGWSGGEWSLAIGGSLDPTFRPKVAVRADTLLNTGAQSPWTVALDASFAEYVAGDVETVTLGLDRAVYGDRGKLSARFIVTHDETGADLPGFSTGASWRFTPRFDASASYVDAAETDTGHTVRVRAVGIAGNYILTDTAILHASVTNEARENSYDRVEFALGATAKF
jgi:YaiO family outer membrane protein